MNGMNARVIQDAAAVLAVSVGTSCKENQNLTIGAIEEAIAKAFPEYEIRRAFMSRRIIKNLKERDGLEIDHVEEAFHRLVQDGITRVIVQPTFLMHGQEYMELEALIKNYEDNYRRVVMGKPLLAGEADFDAAAKAIISKMAPYDDGETAICLMGHGTESSGNEIYGKLQDKIKEAGYKNYYIGTMKARPSLEDVLAALRREGPYRKVVLQPLMVAAGAHARNEMAGSEDGAWKTVLEREGYEVTCLLEGLGQIPAIWDIYVGHVREVETRL